MSPKIRKIFNKDLSKKNVFNFFFKSFVVAIAVGIITLFFEATAENLLIFSCLGASAIILVNYRRYKLSNLRIVIESYLLTAIISIAIVNFFKWLGYHHLPTEIFFVMLLSSLAVYFFDCVHPPAVASGIAFTMYEGMFSELFFLICAIIMLLIIVRMLMYLRYHSLEIDKFHLEFFNKKNDKNKNQK